MYGECLLEEKMIMQVINKFRNYDNVNVNRKGYNKMNHTSIVAIITAIIVALATLILQKSFNNLY